ncbi:MAG: hypothetical protein WKF82_07705 [Nocardioidaceae bacterium]
MASTLDRTRQEIDKLLTDSTVLHAVVGAGDLAVAKLRETHSELSARTGNFDPKVIREQAQATLLGRVGAMPHDVKAAPQQVKALPEKAQAAIGDAVVNALNAYGDLAIRGRTLVERIRHQPESAEMQEQAETTVSLAQDTLDTATHSGAATAEQAAAATAEKVGDQLC